MISSYQKEKLEVGKTYWTFYFGLSNKGNKLQNYTGLFQAKILSLVNRQYGDYFEWEIIGGHFSGTMSHNVRLYLNGYGTAYCHFSEDMDECIKFHDNLIRQYGKDLNTKDRDVMYKKLITKQLPPKSNIEIDSVAWIKSLSAQEKKYLRWIKEFYESKI